MTTLNDAFEIELTQQDEGYESGSESFHIPTPLIRAPRAYHVSTVDELSFNLENFGQSPTTPMQHAKLSPCRHSCHSLTHHLVLTSSNDESPKRPSEQHSPHSSASARSPTPGKQMFHLQYTTTYVTASCLPGTSSSWKYGMMMIPPPLTNISQQPFDDVWTEEQIPDRHLCIHKRPDDPNHQCSYPCPYDSIPPSGWTYCNPLCEMKQCLTTNRWTSVTSHWIFQIS